MVEAAKVRVGVRVRPLLRRELAQGVPRVISHPSEKQVLVDGNEAHRFTYDHVFPVHASQRDLYASTAAQMLQPFLDGYNVTILAYGQTGSGKTYTMGSECGTTDKYDDERRGLIPRFLYDMFMNLNADVSHRLEANAMASFLEIYGEDVYDLLSDGVAPGTKHISLQVLEDKGGVFVNGLTQVPVLGWEAALDVLSQGVLNRTTASTLMNTVSSRSHAVFTITLTQTLKDDADPDGDPQTVTSKLTFVDLAGSERLGRTGAEGQRKREGIQINQGLLALGNVVNALGDDRADKKNMYVPYRQSKLTRLLQDALGGNSQTLFIACVSPAADSVNETVAALHYANRARNIKNKAVKNTDGAKAELRRLRGTAAALQLELVWEHFQLGPGGPNAQGSEEGNPEATGGAAGLGLGADVSPEEVLGREDVKAYLKTVQSRVAELVSKRQNAGVPLLLVPGIAPDPEHPSGPLGSAGGAGSTPSSYSRAMAARRILCDSRAGAGDGRNLRGADDGGITVGEMAGGEDSVCSSGGVADVFERDELEHDPEEELAVLDQLIEWQRQTGEYGDAAKEEEKRLEETDSQIREKESMLLKVRETLQGYHHMRERFDALLCKIGELEKEKISLLATMKSATASGGSVAVKGGSTRDPPVAEALRERLKCVESQLAALGAQRKKQERAVMLLQRESKKCEDLQEGLAQLKRQKVVLQKRQREAAKRHREYEQRMSREIQAMRKKNNRDLRHMSKMELEVRRQKAATDRKSVQVGRVGDKLKKTEEHLLRLLSLRKQQGAADRARARRGGRRVVGGGSSARGAKGVGQGATGGGDAEGLHEKLSGVSAKEASESSAARVSEARVSAAKHLLDRAVSSRVEQEVLRQEFAAKIRAYDEATSLQVSNIGMLRDYRAQLRDLKASNADRSAAASITGVQTKAGAENVDPGSSPTGSTIASLGRHHPGDRSSRRGIRGGGDSTSSGRDGDGAGPAKGRKVSHASVGDVDTLEGQRAVLDALIQETEKAVDDTQERLEMLSVDLDDMCRRLGMGDTFQGRSGMTEKVRFDSPRGVGSGGDRESDVAGSSAGCTALGPREFKALEGLTSVESRQLVTALVDDITAAGIGEMVLKEEASKQAAEMVELRERNKSMKDELFRLSQRYSRRMSMMKVDHTRDMVRLSMLDSCGDSAEDSSSSCLGSSSGHLQEEHGEDDVEDAGPHTPSIPAEVSSAGYDRVAELGPLATNLFASPLPRQVKSRASWGGQRSPRVSIFPHVHVPSPISSRDACEASANRRLSGQQIEGVIARQRQLEGAAEADKKRLEKVVERNRALTQDLQRERAERQRVQARLVVVERSAEGVGAESLRDTVGALEGLWAELGVPQDQRMGLMNHVASGVLKEAQQQLGQARDESLSMGAKVGSLKEDLRALWAMLGKGSEEEATVAESLAGKPLRVQAEQLAAMVLTAGEEVSAGAARRAKLRAAASAAVRVLELTEKDIGPNLAILLRQSRFNLPRALQDDEDMVALSLEHGTTDEQEHELLTTPMDRTAYVVGGELLSAFEGEVRKLRAMQAEALAGYHEVREAAREAVLSMDLTAEEVFDITRKAFREGLVRLSGDDDSSERRRELDEDALDYACALLCRPKTTHVHVSRSRTQHLKMAWSAVKLAEEQRTAVIKDAKVLVERAHKEFATATSPSSMDSFKMTTSTPPALEAFLEGVSEDFPPLSKGVLEAYEGELLRLRDSSLAARDAAALGIEASRAALRDAGSTSAMERLSDLSAPPSPASLKEGQAGGQDVGASLLSIERLSSGDGARSEKWLDEASSSIIAAWGAVRQALGSLAADKALAQALARRVSALEGVQSSDQDICQLAQRMVELQSTLDPGRLSKRNKSSTHLLEAEKNRNACQATRFALHLMAYPAQAYTRALKRLKEQLKNWREAYGCGFDPSLLSDVAREALHDYHRYQRSGRTGAKIEHILPHLDSIAGNSYPAASGGSALRTGSPELSGGGSGGGGGYGKPRMDFSPDGLGESSMSVMNSIANPGLMGFSAGAEADDAASMSVGNSGGGGGNVHSFRGRGGAFGMLLHKVQTSQNTIMPGAGIAAASSRSQQTGGSFGQDIIDAYGDLNGGAGARANASPKGNDNFP